MKVRNIRIAMSVLIAVLLFLPVNLVLAADPITIGAPLSTAFLYGWDAERGMRLAIEEINAAGGVKVGDTKRPFNIEVIDTRDLEPVKALNYYYEGLKYNFDDADIHRRVGLLNYRIGNIDESITAYMTALNIDSTLTNVKSALQSLNDLKEMEKTEVGKGFLQVSQIALKSKEEAERVLDMLNSGAHFGALAYRYSLDNITRETGGRLPFIDPENTDYVFIDIVKNMRAGTVSGVLQSGGMYFILKRIYLVSIMTL